MSVSRSHMESPYMQWAKLHSTAAVNLATSAVPPLTLDDLPLKMDDLALDTHGSYGYGPLLERLARYTGVDPKCIVTAPGTSMANYLAMAASFEPGEEVLFEQPTYEPILSTARYLGAELRRFERRPEEHFRLNAKEIERQMTPRTRLIVLANLHNPTSALSSEEDLRAVGEIARKAGARVLVDEVYLEALYDGRPRVAFQLGPEFITTSSLTKAYGLGGLRCGWVVAEPALARRIWHIRDLHDVNSSHPAQRISVVVFDHLERLAKRAHSLLRTNRALANHFLEEHPKLTMLRSGHGTVVALRAPGGDEEGFCKLLREKYETAVVPGRFFEMPGCFRLGIAGETEALREGLERLAAAVKHFKPRGA